MKSSNIGGQAVLEGIMMKHREEYAVAVRKPDGQIEVSRDRYTGIAGRVGALARVPFIRGIFNFVDSLVLGMKTLTWSASFFEDEEEEKKELTKDQEEQKEGQEKWIMRGVVAFSVVLAVGIFMVLPYFLSGLLEPLVPSYHVRTVIEGFVRIGIFIVYILLISRTEDIQRTFMYHGAEHKCINCIENGLELNVENVMKSSRQHKRCGTSFLLLVMVVSVLMHFVFVLVPVLWMRVVGRILLIPVVAGVAFEFIRLAGKSEHPLVCAISKPGLALQKLTTREPDESMVEVAIAAVEAVFDWKNYLRENFGHKEFESEREAQ